MSWCIRRRPGRYCLNDLHKAAGGEKKHQPGDFTRRAEFNALLGALLENSANSQSFVSPYESVGGRNGGTYVVKELVYSYAMWISPAFHLKVIRAYAGLVAGTA
ncbi:MAG: KilA-N domain-containing protein [Acidovorax sp.]|nr:KilA-N domain-containing protein [Acidovorax sp.]